MNDYPNWVIDLINAVDEYEEMHAPAGDDLGVCLAEARGQVPAAVLQGARMARRYVREMAGDPA